jgi:hypothetical protein
MLTNLIKQRIDIKMPILIELVSKSHSLEYSIRFQSQRSVEEEGRYMLILIPLSLLISMRGNRNLIREEGRECKLLMLSHNDREFIKRHRRRNDRWRSEILLQFLILMGR